MNRINQQIDYWYKSALRSWQIALVLFDSKHYDACLFFCHLAIEKLAKGLVIHQTKKEAPFIHDLNTLAQLAKIEFTKKQGDQLKIITTFNIAGRYSDAKYDFYKKCTRSYTQEYLKTSKEIFLWLKKEYQKK
ncbi:MAG: HEPN domain-containing protein [Candidatus Kuenenbacteria bacterium]